MKEAPSYAFGALGETADTNFENLLVGLEGLTEVNIFERFLSEDVLNAIITETHRYARDVKNDANFEITKDELKVFIGVLILSGYHQLPSERDYWSEDEDLSVALVRNAIPRNRYMEIKAMLHFANNAEINQHTHDRGYKVRMLIDKFNENFQKWGVFDKHLSIDEMMVRYYGHHPLKQYIKGKPIRFGYKFWAICGSNGYCYKFDLYAGKAVSSVQQPLGTRVVKGMLECVTDPNSHMVFFDNFFNSHDLLVELREMGFRATGTLRKNRVSRCPLQSDKALQKMKRGSYDAQFDSKNNITILKWNDNNCVTIGTNFDEIKPLQTVVRHQKRQAAPLSINQPMLIHNYNKFMGGVDQHDWLLEKHCISIHGTKWYWPIFTRVIDMAVVNTHILYNKISATKKSIKDIRRSVAVYYLKLGKQKRTTKGPVPEQTGHTSVSDAVRLDQVGHIIGKRDRQRRCQYKSCTGKPLTFCTKCTATLCMTCFPKFHL